MDIVYEDSSILIINKPSGLVVTRSLSYRGETLEDQLGKYFSLRDRGVGERAGIVHRLDKETSGLLLVAKTAKAYTNLCEQFKKRKVKKKYWALVYGGLTFPKGEIEVSLSRNPKNRRKFCVSLKGREAMTQYKSLAVYSFLRSPANSPTSEVKEAVFLGGASEKFTLLEVRPITGRTHQIRVHLSYIGHPVVGDPLYSGRKKFRRDRVWCPRLFLHAFYLGFFHPESGEWAEFKIKLPEKLGGVLEKL